MTGVTVELLEAGYCRQPRWGLDGALSLKQVTLPALVAIIRHPKLGAMLFDTGYGRPLVELRSWAARIYKRVLPFHLQDVRIPRVDSIFLSHFHPDHIGALRDFGAVPILHSREGLRQPRGWQAAFFPELLPDDFDIRARAIEDLPLVELSPDWAPFESARDVAGDGSLLAVALPGHAVGQYGLVCSLEDGRTLFLVADAAWIRTNITEVAVPPWPARALFADIRTYRETLQKLNVLMKRRPEVLMVPSHCALSIADAR
jgi:glyoxylase-like metal-dependent hydrolase (beta-lactamase superfamily II)